MNENLPGQLRPLSSLTPKIWGYLSFGLIVGGLALMSWGGWLFTEQQIEAAKPPPAPIVKSLDLLPPETSTSARTPSPIPSQTSSPTATSTEAATPQPQEAVATSTSTASPTASPTLEPSPTSQPVAELSEEEPLSLADNPLIVEESAPPASALAIEMESQTENSAEAAAPVAALPAPITRLVAESIGLDTPVVGVGWTESVINGTIYNIWQVASYAAGWHNNSALPGQGDNIVLSGHHNILGEVFRYTVDLEIGDTITLYLNDQPYAYAVTDKFIVKDKDEPEEVRVANARWIGPFDDERVTLVTCWPYTNNTHRVIVIAKPVGATSDGLVPTDAGDTTLGAQN
jgi:sortase A